MKQTLIAIVASILIMVMTPAKMLGARHDMPDDYTVSFITMQQGLPHNFVEDIFRDSNGYIWISTSASLARYDGYQFVSFTPNSLSHNIKSSFSRDVAEDRFGRLWVASDGGIDIIDLKDLSVINPSSIIKLKEYPDFTLIPTTSVTLDRDGNIWMHNTTDIICLTFDEKGNISRYLSTPHKIDSVVTFSAVKALPDKLPGVLTAIGSSICHLSVAGNEIKSTPLSPDLKFDPMIFIADFAATDSRIWIATEDGLFSYNTDNGVVELYNVFSGPGRALSQNFVTSLALTPDGELLIGCLNGLNLLSPTSGTITTVDTSSIAGQPHNLSINFINCLLSDGDNLWVGTEGFGLNLFSPKRIDTKMLCHNSAVPSSLSPNGVNAIHEDGDGTLWVGTVEGGLNRGAGGYESGFSHFTCADATLPHNSVSAITSDHTGHLWVGTWGGGLAMLDRLNPRHNPTHLRITPTGRSMDYIGSLIFDPLNNLIWIGVNTGIYIYNLESGDIEIPFKGAESFRGSVASVIAPDGNLWIGGLDGLLAIDLHKTDHHKHFNYRHYPFKLDDTERLVPEKVTALAVAHDATIWVGTNGNGLYRYDRKSDRFSNLSIGDGLPSDAIHGIAEDLQGNLWIATYHGLSCLTPAGRFINFNRDNGLPTEQFYWNAYRRLANGEILFGSVDGMLAVKHLESLKEEQFPVHFTSLSVGDSICFGNPQNCRISENDRNFEIGFSAFDYASQNSGRYYYRMKGYEDEWKQLPAGRHSVAYMNLLPGNYSLEVKYVMQNQDVETAPVSRFEVEILPNFYRRPWFIFLIILILIGVVIAIYRWRLTDLKRQRNELQKAVEESVREISEQKAQVQQLTADRISFFTNITHEFRTPITLIIGPIERAMRLSSNPKVIEQLNFVARNSRYLLSLVNQLMDFRKIESGKMEPVTTKGDIRRSLEEIILPFQVYAMERGITLRTVMHFSSPIFPYNEDTLRKVLTNLIGNAIKFTPDNGTVTIYAAMLNGVCRDGDKRFYLCVSDTGCGLEEGDSEKVFDHFYQGKNRMKYPLIGATDSGIGLYLCRKLVEIYGGTISARNNRGAGCSFRVILPIAESTHNISDSGNEENYAADIDTAEEAAADRKLRILVVEDNADMRAFMRSVLADNYSVAEAGDGEEALKILLSTDIDLIISDLMMPRMDGLELAAKVKGNFTLSHIPFIMLTAKTASEARLEGYRKGIDAYILKPFDEEMLLARIRHLLARDSQRKNRFIDDMKVEHLEIEEESRDRKFVDKVMEVLRDNYSNSYFEVAEFAEALGVSRSLLNKKLQSLMGQSANQLIRTYRLRTAYELIVKNRKTRSMNVTEIAFQVGFNDSKYFTRCFTKQYGVAPSAVLKGENPTGVTPDNSTF